MKKLQKILVIALFAVIGVFAFKSGDASAYGQGAYSSTGGTAVGGTYFYSGIFWNYLRWTDNRDLTFPKSLYMDPPNSPPVDVGPSIYEKCKDAKGFWVLLSNTPDNKSYSGFVRQVSELNGSYGLDRAKGYSQGSHGAQYYGYRLLGSGGYAYIPPYADEYPGRKSGGKETYDAARAAYDTFLENHPDEPDLWSSGELTFFCDAGETKKENEFLSKSGAGYNGQTKTFTDFDKKETIPTIVVGEDVEKVTVNFSQRVYIKLDVSDVAALNNYSPELKTTYSIYSSQGGAPTQGNTTLTTKASGWQKENGYFYYEKTFDKEVTIPAGGTVKICQGTKYDPKKFTITGSNVTYSGNGESEICIIFSRDEAAVPEVDYCPEKYDATLSYGSTYGWSEIKDLTTGANALSTMSAPGPESDVDYKGTDTVTIYAQPGDTVRFRHALCYGAQKVRSSNNTYVSIGTTRTSRRNLKANEFEIYGAVRKVEKQTVNNISDYAHNTNFDFGKFNAANGGVIGAGRLKLLAGENEKSATGTLKVLNGPENADHTNEPYKEYKVNGVSKWGFMVTSPYGLSTNELRCYGGDWYIDKYKKDGFQINSAYSGGSCDRFFSLDVGKGIAQQLIYNDVKNWIKEAHSGTNAQYRTYWCGCNPRKYYHDEVATTGKDAPWHAEGTGWGDDKNKYYDLKGTDLTTIYKTISDINADPLGGPGNWGRERSGKSNSDTSGDAPVNMGRGSDTNAEMKYNNDSVNEKNSTLSIGNYGTVSYETLKSLGQNKIGWNYFNCTSAGNCNDTWREYAVTDDEHDNPIMPDFKDETTTTPTSSWSSWQDSEPTGYTYYTGTMYRCNGSWGWSTTCSESYSSYDTDTRTEWICTSYDPAYYYLGDDGYYHYGTCDDGYWNDYTVYNFTCPHYGGGYWTRSFSYYCYNYYDDSKTVYRYLYYYCPGSYPFDGAYSSFSDARSAKWTSSDGHTCYRYHFVCPESYAKDGLSYKVFGDDQYNWPSAACRTHTCNDGWKPNKNNTTTSTDSNEVNACSKCANTLAGRYPTGTKADGVLQNVNGFNPSDPKNGEGTTGMGSKTDTSRGCQFSVNVRPNYSTAKNQVKSNITNNGSTNEWAIPQKDDEPTNTSYRNGQTSTAAANDITKTAEVLVPYNYYLTVGSSISSGGAAYLGEDIRFGTSIKVNPRINTSVSATAYATYTRTPEDDPEGIGTKLQAIQFIIPPASKASFTGEISDSAANSLTSASDLCSLFPQATKCQALDTGSENGVWNEDGNPEGTDVIKSEEYISVTIPDNPAEIEVGSLFCVVIGAYPADSHAMGNATVVSGMSTFQNAKWALSNASCRTVSKKPSFQVWNGSTYTEASIKTSTADKAVGWSMSSSPAGEDARRFLGSWDEYAVIANGTVEDFASGAANGYGSVLKKDEYNDNFAKQTISNTNASSGTAGASNITGVSPTTMITKLLGRYSTTDTSRINTAFPSSSPVELSTNSKAYYYQINSATLNGATFQTGTHVVRVSGTLTINGNICIGTGNCSSPGTSTITSATDPDLKVITNMYLSQRNSQSFNRIDDLPQVIIIADNIKIGPEVTQVDAWLIAASIGSDNRPSSYGTVNTCTGSVANAQTCNKLIMINGPIIANELLLNRTGGAHQGDVKITGSSATSCSLARLDLCNLADNGSATPAEIINLRPDIYLWAYSQLNRYTQATTTYSREQAPRY